MNSIPRANKAFRHITKVKPAQSNNPIKIVRLNAAKFIDWLTNGKSSWAESVIVESAKSFASKTSKYDSSLLTSTYNRLRIKSAKNIITKQIANRLIEELTLAIEKPLILTRALAHTTKNTCPRAKNYKKGVIFHIPIYKHTVNTPKVIPKAVWNGFINLKENAKKHMIKGQEKLVERAFNELLNTMSDRINHPDHLQNKRLAKLLDKEDLPFQIMKQSIPKIKKSGHDKLAKIMTRACS